jgi:hypothetical protein
LEDKGLTHSLKKVSGGSKKRKKKDADAEPTNGLTNGDKDVRHKLEIIRTSTPVNEGENADRKSGINNTSTASLTAKVMEEQERAKKRKMDNENVRSLFSSRDQSKPIGRSSDFMTRGYSLPAGGKR